MALWLKINGIGEKEDQPLRACMGDDLIIRAEPLEKYIDIGHSRFTGKLLSDDDKLIIVDDEKLDRALDYHAGFNIGYDEGRKAGYKSGITDSKRKFYKGKTFKEIHDEAYAEGVKDA